MEHKKNRDISKLQNELRDDMDTRRNFVDASNPTDSESGSDEDQRLEIKVPRKRRSRGNATDHLLEELIRIQRDYVKSQKKVFEITAERDIEEARNRYVKLDLNNATVKADEEKEARIKFERGFHHYRSEAIVSRIMLVAIVLIWMYKMVHGSYY